jgi:excisionase family DNA binding protein
MIDRASMDEEPSHALSQQENAYADLAAAVRDLAARVDVQAWPRWLSVEAAARYTSLSPRSIRNLIAAGRVTPSRAVRGRVLIDRLELDAALSAECGTRPRRGRGIRRH